MEYITVSVGQSQSRATEVISDLRIVAETFFGPMKMVGFWDRQEDMHLCPFLERHKECPHTENISGESFPSYERTLERERQASLAVIFPHANVTLYMS